MIKEKIVSFERKHQIVPKVVSVAAAATTALTCASFSASAEEAGASTVDISSVTSAMTTSLTDIVSKVAVACAGVVGVGLTIFAIKWAVRTIKSFFAKIAG